MVDASEPVAEGAETKPLQNAKASPRTCPKGHLLDAANAYARPSHPTWTECRTCRRAQPRPKRPRKANPQVAPPVPTAATRGLVGYAVTIGGKLADIAAAMGISRNTLQHHYRAELDRARVRVDAAIGRTYVQKMLGGTPPDWEKANTQMLIWYTKARMGWSTPANDDVFLAFKLTRDDRDI